MIRKVVYRFTDLEDPEILVGTKESDRDEDDEAIRSIA